LPNVLPFSALYLGQGEGTAFANGNSYFGEPPEFQVCVCDGGIKMAHCTLKRKELGKQPHLMN